MQYQHLLLFFFCAFISCNQGNPTSVNEALSDDELFEETPNVTSSLPVEQDRYAWQKPDLVMNKLGDLTGKVVADIGAGTGYFTFRLMQDAAKVIAVDIDPNMINLIEIFKQNLDSIQQLKVEPRLATADDPNLGEGEVDVVVIINTIGYIEDRSAYLNKLSEKMTEGGEIMIVDFKMKRIPSDIAPEVEYRVSLLELEDILLKLGYDVVDSDDRSLDYQYIVKARKS